MLESAIPLRFREVQDTICQYFNQADGNRYLEDRWAYQQGEGGGISRVWENDGMKKGVLLEKAGVNFSSISGKKLPPSALEKLKLPADSAFQAMGVSLVIHPCNPHIPTTHLNIRYFEVGDQWWCGGGVDVTPYYPLKEQIIKYHQDVKLLCEKHDQPYSKYKHQCDEYFYLKHRQECRGVGGIFFDHLQGDKDKALDFVMDLGNQFVSMYRPFVEANKDKAVSEEEREFQLYRRGRYVEFNLLYDRGTHFGLSSGGRTESILMSMPPMVRWDYNRQFPEDSPERELTDYYLKPQDWCQS